MQEKPKSKFRISSGSALPRLRFAVTCIVISSLMLSPLIAEAQDRSPHPLKMERARQRLMNEPTAPPAAAALPLVPPNDPNVLPDRTNRANADPPQRPLPRTSLTGLPPH